MHNVRVDIVSDVMCPWCYIGKKRLDLASELLDGIHLDVHWLPFQLDGTLPKQGKPRADYLAGKFGGKERAQIAYSQIEETGAAMDIPFAFDLIEYSSNTLDAHRLIHWAEQEDLQNQMAERLFQAYFLEGQNIGDDDVLAALSGEVGMDDDEILDRLHTDLAKDIVKQQIGESQKLGISGVPCFILGQKYAVMGAQEPETLAEAITRTATEASAQAAS
uniref:DsbA family oxidoreductase n=1 Tax=Pararhizobium sp. IMCC3301 TaxID=3067904 RepID=UPI002740FA9A|nr:DsbA family oxidoreductase [Pararhizobium sp. IMCC3301]